jgi:hypothetical protein
MSVTADRGVTHASRVIDAHGRLLTPGFIDAHLHLCSMYAPACTDPYGAGQRYEVIDGELFVTPSPSYDHQAAVAFLQRRLAEYLERERVGYALLAPADVTFSPEGSSSRMSSSFPS